MKRILYRIIGIFAILLTLASCSPEEIEGLDQSGRPQISGVQIDVTVSGKVVTYHSEELVGCVPVWTISGANLKVNQIYTKNDFQVTYSKVGTYTVEFKAYNRNGVSDGSVITEFVIQ